MTRGLILGTFKAPGGVKQGTRRTENGFIYDGRLQLGKI